MDKKEIQMEIQFNSVYVRNNVVITLFFSESRNEMYYVVDTIVGGKSIPRLGEIHIEVPEVIEEMKQHSEHPWGSSSNVYYFKFGFIPLSEGLWQFIQDCWDAVKRQEKELFSK